MKGKIIFIVINIIIIPYALLVGGRVPYFLLYTSILVALVPLVHCILGKMFIKGMVKLPEKEMVSGDEISIKYEFENPSSINFPILEFENNIAYRLTGKKEKKEIFHLEKQGYYEGSKTIPCRRRGHYKTGKVKLYIKDIFNIYSLQKTVKTPLSFKVYPRITPLKSFKIQASQYMGELIVKDPLFQDYSSLSDLRTYQEGDSVKKIHWKASAKSDDLIVKNYEERGDNEVVLVIDSNKESYAGDKEYWIEDKLVETCASIVDYCLKQNINVTLYHQQHDNIIETKGNNPGFLKKFMDDIVGFHPNGSFTLQQNIEKITSYIKSGVTLFVLTPRLNKQIGAQAIDMSMRSISPVYIILGSKKENPVVWNNNKEVAKALEGESIPTYMIDIEQDIREALEGKYERRA